MSEHTPGPWMYGVRKDQSIWLSIGDPAGYHYQGDLVASEADARLIAAAPELLSALDRLAHSYRLLLAGKPVRDVEETLAEVDHAISKATKSEAL